VTKLEDISALIRPNHPADWTNIDSRAVDAIRVLAANAVQKVGNGHAGTAMSLAPLAYTLFQRQMRHDPSDVHWLGRDRFVLSAGHSSLTLYIQLFLAGFGLELSDLEALRTWGSKTPGHPEFGHTRSAEITTGPLGQGLASAVEMAMASRYERGLFDPDAAPGTSPFDHYVYVIASDGDIEEGVTSEASSLAGTQQLGNLIVFYDHNRISIEDDTNIALSEDTPARCRASGWHVQEVEGGENVLGIEETIEAARAVTDRPSLIAIRTIIGYPAPTKMNTGKAHGAALGDEEVAAVKKILGFDPEKTFEMPEGVLEHTRKLIDRGKEAHAKWQQDFDAWAAREPERKALLDRLLAQKLPDGWDANLPSWEPDSKPLATRATSGAVLAAVGSKLSELWGGSADLAESNLTTIKGADSFGPPSISTKEWTTHWYGRTLHFGIRDHAMGASLSGIVLHGPTRAYGGTHLTFSDYMRPAVRLASRMAIDTCAAGGSRCAADRHRVGAAIVRRGAEDVGGAGNYCQRGVDAVRGWFEFQPVEYRDSVLPPAVSGGSPSRRPSCRAGTSSAIAARSSRSSTTAHQPTIKPFSANSGSPPRPSPPPPNDHCTIEEGNTPMTQEKSQNPNLAALSAAGVSVWLDDLSRDRLRTGSLQELIDTRCVVGVTTNPTIFQKALSEGHAYDEQIAELAERGADVDAAVRTVTTDDVREACDVLRPQWEASDGVDGRVSLEVDPRLAHDTDKTILQAIELWKIVDRPNVLIKIPATRPGLPAITAVLAEGVSVNVTLIFAVERHRAVMDVYLAGLEAAKQAGHDLSKIHSVASFFVSRVDTEIDKRLEKIGTDEALALRGQAGVANARLAYAAYQEAFLGDQRFEALKVGGARVQRPLWASTGVKNPDYSDTLYVTELVAPNTVNTMPEKTIDAVADHGVITGDTVTGRAGEAQGVFDKLSAVGVDLRDVFIVLENEGVEKFEASWNELLKETQAQLDAAAK
jgi:transaldolase